MNAFLLALFDADFRLLFLWCDLTTVCTSFLRFAFTPSQSKAIILLLFYAVPYGTPSQPLEELKNEKKLVSKKPLCHVSLVPWTSDRVISDILNVGSPQDGPRPDRYPSQGQLSQLCRRVGSLGPDLQSGQSLILSVLVFFSSETRTHKNTHIVLFALWTKQMLFPK